MVVRTGCELTSAKVDTLPRDTTCFVLEERRVETGSVLRYAEPSPSSTAHTARGQFVLCLGPASAPDGVPYAAPREGGA